MMSAAKLLRRGADYRPDIDGLRAIAVLAVIIFHINPALIPGGFAGVDIFFVISGYLITGHMAGELSSGRFSLAEFYRRRIKRIAPAMLVVVAATLLAGIALLLPEDLTALAKSSVWSVASLANVYFWREVNTDYFAPGSESLPLLHLWSLGVEEQFYLLWPLLLMAIWKLAGKRPGAAERVALGLAVLLVPLSCLLAAWWFDRDGMFVYYMLPTRAGELGTGAALALGLLWRPKAELSPRLAGVVAGAGLLLVALSMALLSEAQPFPGWRSLPPTLGAALMIAAGALARRHWLSPALSSAPMVWVGAISYSAYLWHWPLLAYWRYLYGQPGWAMQFFLFALTLLLSWLSYRWVEQPARKSGRTATGILLRMYLLPGGGLMALGIVLVFGARFGMNWPDPAYLRQLSELREQVQPAYRSAWACQHSRLSEGDITDERCILGRPSEQAPRVLLWGDSNAAHYIPMLRTLADAAAYRFRNIEIGSCPPLLSDPRDYVTPDRYADCAASLPWVHRALDAYPVIILAGSWNDYQQRSPDFLDQLEATVAQLSAAGHQVRLLGKVPMFRGYDRQCDEKAVRLPWLDCRVPDRPVAEDVASINAAMRRIASRHPGTVYFEATEYLCPGHICSVNGPEGRRRYYDPGHLSVKGSAELGQLMLAHGGVPKALNFSSAESASP